MRLADIYQAAGAWGHLSTLKIPPAMAYKLMKQAKLIGAEAELIEVQRVKILREVSGIAEGDIDLRPGTPGYAAFAEAFNKFLATDSDVPPLALSLDQLVEAISSNGNSLTVADLALLEPFFS